MHPKSKSQFVKPTSTFHEERSKRHLPARREQARRGAVLILPNATREAMLGLPKLVKQLKNNQSPPKLIVSPALRRYHGLTGWKNADTLPYVPKALVVLEGLYALGYQANEWFSRQHITSVCREEFGMSDKLVWQALQVSHVFQKRKAPGKKNQSGPRPYLFRIPSPLELQAEFAPEAVDTPSDILHFSDLKNLTTYRMGLHRELFIRLWLDNDGEGFEMARGLMADRLGVSERTIRTYDQKLGHSSMPNYNQREIGWHNWNSLPRYKNKYDAEGKHLPSKKFLKVVDVLKGYEYALPLVRFLGYQALREGCQVFEMERLVNTYYPYAHPNPKKYDGGAYSVDYYYDLKAGREAAGFFQHNNEWAYYGQVSHAEAYAQMYDQLRY